MLRSSYNIVFLCCIFLLSSCSFDSLGKPPFDELVITDTYEHISMPDGRTWDVVYEFPSDSTFTGVVRHTSLWLDPSAPFMSHDILVTTGEFTSRASVDVSVMGHKFFYHWKGIEPTGTINLLHIFPASADVFEQLAQIRKWDNVTISGREIYKINKYDSSGKYVGYMSDAGCNTILVKSVTVNAVGTPIP